MQRLKELAEECQALCQQYNVPFIVNDDVEFALELDADGVHIGQQDGVVAEVRAKIGRDKVLGVSAHTLNDALAASDAGANYVGIGPIYETTTKPDAESVVGPELISQVVRELPGLPVVGIGGFLNAKWALLFVQVHRVLQSFRGLQVKRTVKKPPGR